MVICYLRCDIRAFLSPISHKSRAFCILHVFYDLYGALYLSCQRLRNWMIHRMFECSSNSFCKHRLYLNFCIVHCCCFSFSSIYNVQKNVDAEYENTHKFKIKIWFCIQTVNGCLVYFHMNCNGKKTLIRNKLFVMHISCFIFQHIAKRNICVHLHTWLDSKFKELKERIFALSYLRSQTGQFHLFLFANKTYSLDLRSPLSYAVQ